VTTPPAGDERAFGNGRDAARVGGFDVGADGLPGLTDPRATPAPHAQPRRRVLLQEYPEEALFALTRRFAKDESGNALEYSLAVAGIFLGLMMAVDALHPEWKNTLAKLTLQLATLAGGWAVASFKSRVDPLYRSGRDGTGSRSRTRTARRW
jgi:Flp pilus assembly pilin Flp